MKFKKKCIQVLQLRNWKSKIQDPSKCISVDNVMQADGGHWEETKFPK